MHRGKQLKAERGLEPFHKIGDTFEFPLCVWMSCQKLIRVGDSARD